LLVDGRPLVGAPLVCCRCGGPLANPESLPALIDCLYCGTVNSATREATHAASEGVPWEVRKNAIAKFTEALVVALQEGRPPFDVLRMCSAAHLGIAGRADTVARIAIALAQDFERETGASVMRDAVVFSRIAQAYLLALDELRASDDYDLNLPFLTAGPNGPVHLRRLLTAKLLAELAARDPHLAAPPGPPAPTKKKGWWPF
jgi:hypothetical protein